MGIQTKRSLPKLSHAVVYVGRLAGTVTFEPIAERYGYKVLLAAIATVQVVSVISEPFLARNDS